MPFVWAAARNPRVAAAIGKPLVIEETFPLACSIEEMDGFLRRSKARAEGCICFHRGRTTAGSAAATEKKDVATRMCAWLGYFKKAG